MHEFTKIIETKDTTPEITCERYSSGVWNKTSVQVPTEGEFTLVINGQELVSILCTPAKLDCLAVGFLYAQGIISGLEDIFSMKIDEENTTADITLTKTEFKLPVKRTLTSGCGGGISFKTGAEKVNSSLVIDIETIFMLMNKLQSQMEIYHKSGGVHGSALADKEKIYILAEDIGRHNTIDKVQGEYLLRRLKLKDGILLSTGRVTTEMLIKAAMMNVPIIISRTSPTDRAIKLAKDLGIALVGYVRDERFFVYSHQERIIHSREKQR